MSSLYPDESYCTSDIGRILYQLKTDWACTASVTQCGEEKHLAGTHTVYTVEIRCVPTSDHSLSERSFVVSTRFKEMQKLHGALAKLHKQLYLRGTYPIFPAAKLLGSTDPVVIQERKLGIENTLNFAFDSEVLRKARLLHEFVEKSRERAYTAHEITSNDIFYSNSQSILDQSIGDLPDQQAVLSPTSEEQNAEDFEFPDVAISVKSDEDPQQETTFRKTSSAMKKLFPKFRGSHQVTEPDDQPADYLVKAGQLVATAQRAEEEHAYELAFQCYKNAASSLIQGVQIESDMAKRNAVRRKTAKYLVQAEKLYRTYLSLDGSVFNFEGLLTAAMQDPNIMAFQCSNKTMKNYRFIGVLPSLDVEKRVLLVEEKTTAQKYVMKLIEKGNSTTDSRIFLPSNIPHMVQLIQFFETETHIVLLLEYIEPGRLWSFLNRYFEETESRYLMTLAEMKAELIDGQSVTQITVKPDEEPKWSYRGRRLLFTVGVDYERAVEMRDETMSSDLPSDETIICSVGVDPTGRSGPHGPSAEFSLVGESKEAIESKFLQVEEESPATINISFAKGFGVGEGSSSTQVVKKEAENDEELVGVEAFLKNLSVAMKTVRHQLSLRRRTWNHLDLPECLIVHWSAQIVSFLFVLHHEHHEYIGDLNSDNILLDSDGNLMITYFGRWYDTNRRTRLADGYAAPESEQYGWIPSVESDIWTLGAIMFELLCGRSLANAAPHGVLRNMELPFPEQSNVSFVARDVLNMILVPTPAYRPSIEEIRSHPFFRHIDWRLYDNPSAPASNQPTSSTQLASPDDFSI